MSKLLVLLASVVLVVMAASAQDSGVNSIVLMTPDELRAGTMIPADVKFVSSGQPDEAVLQLIADAGFAAVVDFRSPAEDRGLDEQKAVERLGMVYATLPVSGPSDVTFDNAAALDQILAENEGRVLLHCSSGNRAAALYALREKLLGASNDDALAVGKVAGLTRLESIVTERLESE
jgi:uncharacterized protein (TIGR01244 family)